MSHSAILHSEFEQSVVDLDGLIHHWFVFGGWVHHFSSHRILESVIEDLGEGIFVFPAQLGSCTLELRVVAGN